MTFWSGETIKDRVQEFRMIVPFDEKQIDCAAYTLKMGKEAFITPDSKVNRFRKRRKLLLKPKQDFYIPPGQFAFLLTNEYISLPRHVLAFISLKSTLKWKGLINVSGFHVDPGFEGNLVYSVYNAGPQPIHLEEGMDLFLIWFSNLDIANSDYNRLKKTPQTNIKPGLIQEIPGEIYTTQNLSRRIDELDRKIFHWTAGVAIVVVAIGIVSVFLQNWLSILQFNPSSPLIKFLSKGG